MEFLADFTTKELEKEVERRKKQEFKRNMIDTLNSLKSNVSKIESYERDGNTITIQMEGEK